MKTVAFLLSLALVLGGVAASPAVDTASAGHDQCPDPDYPCDPQPYTPRELVCAILEHYGLCQT